MKKQNNRKLGGNDKNISRKTTDDHKSEPLRLNVGEPWPEQFSLQSESLSSIWKNRVTVLLAVCFVTVFLAMNVYAMITKDSQMLWRLLSIDSAGLVSVGLWATGKAALKVLSGWKDHHKEE